MKVFSLCCLAISCYLYLDSFVIYECAFDKKNVLLENLKIILSFISWQDTRNRFNVSFNYLSKV